MAEFNLNDLKEIARSEEIIDLLVDKGIIKEKKFLKQLKYEKELNQLQFEMLRLQEFILKNNLQLVVIYEGRDAAGKGGAINRAIAKMNPKLYDVVALPKPTEVEMKQWYFQKYIQHLPQRGKTTFYDRSWYNRAVVEPVFGFCTEQQHQTFMENVNGLEHLLINDGIVLIKFFLNISKEEQKNRLDGRRADPLKNYKIGGLDEQAQVKWDEYTFYIEKMLKKTSTEKSPWVEVKTDKKRTTRLETLKYILKQFDGFETEKKFKPKENVIQIWDGK